MSRIRWKVLVAMLTVVFVTIAVSALFTRKVTLEEIHRLSVGHAPPDVTRLEEHFRTRGGWTGVDDVIDAMPARIVLTTATPERRIIAASKDVRAMTIAVDANDRMTIAGRDVQLVLNAPPLRVGDAYAYLLPERQPREEAASLDRRLIVTFAAATAVAIVLAFLVSRRITTPLERLTAAVETMARGAKPAHVAVTGRDEIAQLAQAFNAMADALAQQQELRRRLVSDVAHELRTPLTNLRCELEGIQDGLAAPDAARIASLHEEVLHLDRIVADLHDLAIADAGGLQLRRERIDLAATVARAADAFAGASRPVEVTAAADVFVTADPVRIGQVVRNLLSNALRHARGAVRVTVTRGEREAIVSIADDGPGIAAEHLPRVFERFYRVDDARSRAAGGAGLGLAIVKQMVELHGGRVWAENAPQGGAVFTFAIPS